MQRRLHVSAPGPHAHPLPDSMFLAHGNNMHERTDAEARAGSGVNAILNSISSAHLADSHYYYHFSPFILCFQGSNLGPTVQRVSRSYLARVSAVKTCSIIFPEMKKINKYRNNPKFSDRQVWANGVDPDKTAPWEQSVHYSDKIR